MESGIELDGMRVNRMNCIRSSFESSLSFIMSHSFVSNINSHTKREVSIEEVFVIVNRVAKVVFAH